MVLRARAGRRQRAQCQWVGAESLQDGAPKIAKVALWMAELWILVDKTNSYSWVYKPTYNWGTHIVEWMFFFFFFVGKIWRILRPTFFPCMRRLRHQRFSGPTWDTWCGGTKRAECTQQDIGGHQSIYRALSYLIRVLHSKIYQVYL